MSQPRPSKRVRNGCTAADSHVHKGQGASRTRLVNSDFPRRFPQIPGFLFSTAFLLFFLRVQIRCCPLELHTRGQSRKRSHHERDVPRGHLCPSRAAFQAQKDKNPSGTRDAQAAGQFGSSLAAPSCFPKLISAEQVKGFRVNKITAYYFTVGRFTQDSSAGTKPHQVKDCLPWCV